MSGKGLLSILIVHFITLGSIVYGQEFHPARVDTIYPTPFEIVSIDSSDIENILDTLGVSIIQFKSDSNLSSGFDQCYAQIEFSSKRQFKNFMDTLDQAQYHYKNGCLITEVWLKNKKRVILHDTRISATGVIILNTNGEYKVLQLFFKSSGSSRNRTSNKILPKSFQLHPLATDTLISWDWYQNNSYYSDLNSGSNTTTKTIIYDPKKQLLFVIPVNSHSTGWSMCNGGHSFHSGKLEKMMKPPGSMQISTENGYNYIYQYINGVWVKNKP